MRDWVNQTKPKETKKGLETEESVAQIYGSLAWVFPNLCILLTTHAPLYEEEFTLERKGMCLKRLFRVTKYTDEAFCVKVGDFYFYVNLRYLEWNEKKRTSLYFGVILPKKDVN